MMRGRVGGKGRVIVSVRALAVGVAAACCGVLGGAAVAHAGPAGSKPPLTEAQLDSAQNHIASALHVEDVAKEQIAKGEYGEAKESLHDSVNALDNAKTLLERHDLGGVNPIGNINGAIDKDRSIKHFLPPKGTHQRELVTLALSAALDDKKGALKLLLMVPTGTTGPTGTSPLEACAFQPDPTHAEVKVQGTPGASGDVVFNSTTQTQSFTLPSSGLSAGVAVVGPFNDPTPGNYTITVELTVNGGLEHITFTDTLPTQITTTCTVHQ
jgi:hypothetical protein